MPFAMKGRHNALFLHRVATTTASGLRIRRCCYHEVSYPRYGADPSEVLAYRSDPSIGDRDPPLPAYEKEGEEELVRVEMLHAPWNPADVNTVQGRYPSPYPSVSMSTSTSASASASWKGLSLASDRCIGRYWDRDPVIGSEGWGRITHSSSSSSSSSSLPPGTLVFLGLPGLGSLRSSLWVPASAVLPVPETLLHTLGPGGSSLCQLGGTALRLLSDFAPPESREGGVVVIQNAGNSGVGFLASQIAASSVFGSEKNKKTQAPKPKPTPKPTPTPCMVSIVRRHGRSRESFDEMVDYLTRVGKNALVVAEEDFFVEADAEADADADSNPGGKRRRRRTIDRDALRAMQERLRDLSPTRSLPRLALNAVGGDSARLLLRLLEPGIGGSTMVTYGGMSGNPVELATPQLIFGDLTACGYWHSRWMVHQHRNETNHATNNINNTTKTTYNTNNINNTTNTTNNTNSNRSSMVETLSRLVLEEDLECPPAHVVPLSDLREGLLWQSQHNRSSDPSPVRTKLVWDCSED